MKDIDSTELFARLKDTAEDFHSQVMALIDIGFQTHEEHFEPHQNGYIYEHEIRLYGYVKYGNKTATVVVAGCDGEEPGSKQEWKCHATVHVDRENIDFHWKQEGAMEAGGCLRVALLVAVSRALATEKTYIARQRMEKEHAEAMQFLIDQTQDSIRKTMLGENIETPNETHKKKERK